MTENARIMLCVLAVSLAYAFVAGASREIFGRLRPDESEDAIRMALLWPATLPMVLLWGAWRLGRWSSRLAGRGLDRARSIRLPGSAIGGIARCAVVS